MTQEQTTVRPIIIQAQTNQRILLITNNQNSPIEIQVKSANPTPSTINKSAIRRIPFLPRQPPRAPPVIQNITPKNSSAIFNASPLTNESVQRQTTFETCYKKYLKPSMTLASMAGIQLTGADVSYMDMEHMSGAMPTATVEEINVPVFVNGEYCVQCECLIDLWYFFVWNREVNILIIHSQIKNVSFW